jgi:hypothetical protein
MSDLIGGIYPKQKSDRAPDYVIGKLSINVKQFREWMQGHLKANPSDEWINLEMLVGKSGKAYAKLDTWKPDNAPTKEPESEDIPF